MDLYAIRYINNTSGSWTLGVPDNSHIIYGRNLSMVLDNNNRAHISYYDEYYYDLRYANNTGGAGDTWDSVIVDGQDIAGYNVGYYNTIGLDSNGKIHIAYYVDSDSTMSITNKFRYVNNVSGTWDFIMPDTGSYNGMFPSLAIDSDDYVHIVYDAGVTLAHLTNTSGAFEKEYLDTNVSIWGDVTLRIDSQGKKHILYNDDDTCNLRYMVF